MKRDNRVNPSYMRQRIAAWSRALVFSTALFGAIGRHLPADEVRELKADAPKDQLIVGGKLGGYYYAAKPLKEEYDRLRLQVQALRAEIIGGKIGGREAAAEVRTLQDDLERVRQLIDDTKTFIAVGNLSTKTETTEFSLGPEKLLFINGVSKVRLVGWDKPGVACVVEKTVVGNAGQSLDDQFAAIRLVYRHGPAQEEVGLSREERKASEDEFLASPEGMKLTAEQREARRTTIEKIFASQAYFRTFQGKSIDVVEIEGLTYQQGNRQVSYRVMSPGGNGVAGGMWQRHALLTVYVPSCTAIGIRGGAGGLEVDGVKAPLIVRGDFNRDYHAHSHVKDHEGALTVENIALETIDRVRGNVSVTVSADLGNAGIRHGDGCKTQYFELPASYDYRDIEGDLVASLLNVNLQLSNVSGRLDVTDDFGDILLIANTPLAKAVHRLFSQSGNITLQLATDALKDAPLIAATECGTVRVADQAPPLVDGNATGWPGDGLLRRTYRGFATKSDEKPPFDHFGPFMKMVNSFAVEKQAAGLVVISRSGTVQVEPLAE